MQDSLFTCVNSYASVVVCEQGPLPHPLRLNWATRDLLKGAYESGGGYTALAFLEDDLSLTWPALKAWAADTVALSGQSLVRSFIRVEVGGDGRPYSADYPDMPGTDKFKYAAVAVKGGQRQQQRRHFVQAEFSSYAGMFVATREQLRRFIDSPDWECEHCVRVCVCGPCSFSLLLAPFDSQRILGSLRFCVPGAILKPLLTLNVLFYPYSSGRPV